MKRQTSQGKARLSKTARALKSIRSASVRADFENQLRHAETTLTGKSRREATACMQVLAGAVLMLRKTLSESASKDLLSGILADSHENGIPLPSVHYTKNARCAFNTGSCVFKSGSWCMRFSGTWGCGTSKRGPWLVASA